jgi:hypothetical protein
VEWVEGQWGEFGAAEAESGDEVQAEQVTAVGPEGTAGQSCMLHVARRPWR